MNNRIVIHSQDGGVDVVMPAPEMFDPNSHTRCLLRSRGIDFANDDEVLDWITNKDIPSYRSWMLEGESDEDAKVRLGVSDLDAKLPNRKCDISELPSDREFRKAWKDENIAIGFDMVKANNIKRDKFREIRKPMLEKLDVDYMRADEAKDENQKSEIAAKKQALRDVTAFPDFESIEDLKNYMPDVLKGE